MTHRLPLGLERTEVTVELTFGALEALEDVQRELGAATLGEALDALLWGMRRSEAHAVATHGHEVLAASHRAWS